MKSHRINIRCSAQTREQADDLGQLWDENLAEAVARAVQIAHQVEFPTEYLTAHKKLEQIERLAKRKLQSESLRAAVLKVLTL